MTSSRRPPRAYPGYRVVRLRRARNPDQAVDVWLRAAMKSKDDCSILEMAAILANGPRRHPAGVQS